MHGSLSGLSLLLCIPLFAAPVWGATRYVSTSGSDNAACAQTAPCRSVQHAVNVADTGDTISIAKGKFVEPYGVVVLGKDLTFEGAGTFSTRVAAGWSGFSVFVIFSTVAISDLDIMSGRAGWGGGISNQGHLTLENVRVRKNEASYAGGGVYNWSDGVLVAYRTEFSHNAAGQGGGALFNEGAALLVDVRVVANSAASGGGMTQASFGNEVIVQSSEISHNTAEGIENFGSVTLINSTVSGNGLAGIRMDSGSFSTLTHVTVADNGTFGLEAQPGGDVDLGNTIVADNKLQQCSVAGAAVTAAGSLFGDGSCGTFWPHAENLVGVKARLGPLKLNGGYTFTHGLRAGSPAIDAGLPALCATVDQRGTLRAVDGDLDGDVQCDIGAFEYLPPSRSVDF
jgi:hypothetical protein